MRFTFAQKIIATFALLSIYTYANPMSIEGQLSAHIVREEDKYCAGYTDEECDEHCNLGGFGKSQCLARYGCSLK